ncbi:MAG: SurA N-terminal domain-containing protein [Formosimonas sp.]
MFEYIQNNKRFTMVLLVLATVALVFTGGQQMFAGSAQSSVDVAEVGSQSITKQQFEYAFKQQLDRMSAQSGEDASTLDTPEARESFLNLMINNSLLDEAVKSEHLTVSDAALIKALHDDPLIKGLEKTADGSIDMAAYANHLKAFNKTIDTYEADIRVESAKKLLEASMSAQMGMPLAQSDVLGKIFSQTRLVERQVIDLAPYLAKASVTKEQVRAAYDKDPAKYTLADSSDVEYAVMPILPENYAITDEDIKAALGEGTPEQYAAIRKDTNQTKGVLASVAKDRLNDVAQKVGEAVAKNPSDLNALVKEFGGTIASAKDVSLSGSVKPELQNTPLVNSNVREALLKGEHVASKGISNPVQANEYNFVVGKVLRQTPSGLQPFESVQVAIEQSLKLEAAIAAARADYTTKIAGMNAASSIGTEQTVSLMQSEGLDSSTLAQTIATSADTPTLMLSSGTDKLELIRVVGKGTPLDLSSPAVAGLTQYWGSIDSELQLQAYYQVLRARYGVKIHPELLAEVKAATI